MVLPSTSTARHAAWRLLSIIDEIGRLSIISIMNHHRPPATATHNSQQPTVNRGRAAAKVAAKHKHTPAEQ